MLINLARQTGQKQIEVLGDEGGGLFKTGAVVHQQGALVWSMSHTNSPPRCTHTLFGCVILRLCYIFQRAAAHGLA